MDHTWFAYTEEKVSSPVSTVPDKLRTESRLTTALLSSSVVACRAMSRLDPKLKSARLPLELSAVKDNNVEECAELVGFIKSEVMEADRKVSVLSSTRPFKLVKELPTKTEPVNSFDKSRPFG